MKRRTIRVTRDNMLDHLLVLRAALESGDMSKDEAVRLLYEALNVISRQQESRRVAKLAAEEAANAAGALLMPKA